MFKNLNAGAVGIRGLSLADSIKLAQKTGFAGVDFGIREAADLAAAHGVQYVRDLFAASGVRPGQWGLPVAWNQEDKWQADLDQLPKLAALGRDLGCTRTCTWMLSGSNERAYEGSFAWHVDRYRPIAKALADEGCQLGIEFLGPKTIRDRFRHEFIYTLGGLMELARAIGTGNVGLLLDAWHLYTSGDSLGALDLIEAKNVAAVHVNDAPVGVALSDYVDNVRGLPMETGVIDLAGFVRKLAALGYDGPVTPEPFSKRVEEVAARSPIEAAQMTADSMDRLWRAADID